MNLFLEIITGKISGISSPTPKISSLIPVTLKHTDIETFLQMFVITLIQAKCYFFFFWDIIPVNQTCLFTFETWWRLYSTLHYPRSSHYSRCDNDCNKSQMHTIPHTNTLFLEALLRNISISNFSKHMFLLLKIESHIFWHQKMRIFNINSQVQVMMQILSYFWIWNILAYGTRFEFKDLHMLRIEKSSFYFSAWGYVT